MVAVIKALVVAASIAHGVSVAGMDALVACETGRTFDPHIVSRNGLYVGLTQLDAGNRRRLRTWAEQQGLQPDEDDPSQQLNYSLDVIRAGGIGQWPVCGQWLRGYMGLEVLP